MSFDGSEPMTASDRFDVRPIGVIESTLSQLDDAPRQGDEGGPDAWLAIDPAFADALEGLTVGSRVVVLTWLDRADRDVLRTVPRSDPSRSELGVFATRSPDRPNPIGLHEVTVLAIDGSRVRVDDMDAVDGTPIVDVKPVLGPVDDR